MGTLLGFDFGPRKIGVAVGQTVTRSASPLTTLRSRRHKPDWARIEQLIREWRPSEAVVGLPYNMDDSEAVTAPGARRFARQLHGRFGLDVHLVDERLTSLEARRQLGGDATSLELIDAMAAKLILETWLTDTAIRASAETRN
jgi:putative Holliday junction resolvase